MDFNFWPIFYIHAFNLTHLALLTWFGSFCTDIDGLFAFVQLFPHYGLWKAFLFMGKNSRYCIIQYNTLVKSISDYFNPFVAHFHPIFYTASPRLSILWLFFLKLFIIFWFSFWNFCHFYWFISLMLSNFFHILSFSNIILPLLPFFSFDFSKNGPYFKQR